MNKFISKRGRVSNFIVMDLFEEAQNLKKKGKDIIHFDDLNTCFQYIIVKHKDLIADLEYIQCRRYLH